MAGHVALKRIVAGCKQMDSGFKVVNARLVRALDILKFFRPPELGRGRFSGDTARPCFLLLPLL